MKKNVLILFLLLIVKNSIIFSAHLHTKEKVLSNYSFIQKLKQFDIESNDFQSLVSEIPTILSRNAQKRNLPRPKLRGIYKDLLQAIDNTDPEQTRSFLDKTQLYPFEILNAIHNAHIRFTQAKKINPSFYIATREILAQVLYRSVAQVPKP